MRAATACLLTFAIFASAPAPRRERQAPAHRVPEARQALQGPLARPQARARRARRRRDRPHQRVRAAARQGAHARVVGRRALARRGEIVATAGTWVLVEDAHGDQYGGVSRVADARRRAQRPAAGAEQLRLPARLHAPQLPERHELRRVVWRRAARARRADRLRDQHDDAAGVQRRPACFTTLADGAVDGLRIEGHADPLDAGRRRAHGAAAVSRAPARSSRPARSVAARAARARARRAGLRRLRRRRAAAVLGPRRVDNAALHDPGRLEPGSSPAARR